MNTDDDKSTTQWHPLFAELLRPLLQDYYDVQTNVPVGDVPREADILLVRRSGDRPSPFRGLLQHLTTWNILEFKGRSVSARVRHLDLLVELGLGIDRRLNAERVRNKQRSVDPPDVSFWYIVNRFGKRFLTEARRRFGTSESVGPGLWRSQILLRPVFLIDGRSLPVERESVALHLVGEESPATDDALAHLIVDEPGFWELYGSLLGLLHPNIIEEVNRMAATKLKLKRGELDMRPFIEKVGWEKILKYLEVGKLIDTVGPKKVLQEMGIERILANLSAADRQKLKEHLK